tara:strand:+ start:244 stop:783 length:540 start_codon:yes stop_codon:yes gene_type:complete
MSITINGNGTISGYTPTTISGTLATSKLPAGSIIKVTHGTHNTTGFSTTSTSFQNYTASNITVTKLRGPGNVSGGSILLVFGNAWIEHSGSNANNRHLAYSIMRDATELTGLTFGMGNLFSPDAEGYQSNADIKYMDTANLNAGDYVYSMCIKSKDGTMTAQIGNNQRLGTWNILEVAT